MKKQQREQMAHAELNITGIVLAGGVSRRMGSDKALLSVGGVSSIERTAQSLGEVCTEVLLSINDSRPYDFLGLRAVKDIFTGQGPMAGLHACLTVSHTAWNAVVACDMPFARADIIQALLRIEAGSAVIDDSGATDIEVTPDFWLNTARPKARLDAVIPVVEGKPQPLLALYNQVVLASLEDRLRRNELRLMDWLRELKVLYIPVEDLSRLAGRETARDLFNMNQPEDYVTACLWAEERENE